MRLTPTNTLFRDQWLITKPVPLLLGHAARPHFPAILAVQCGHGLSSSQCNMGGNVVTPLQAGPLKISHVLSPSMVTVEANC